MGTHEVGKAKKVNSMYNTRSYMGLQETRHLVEIRTEGQKNIFIAEHSLPEDSFRPFLLISVNHCGLQSCT